LGAVPVVVRDCATLSVNNPRPTISPPSNIDFFMPQPRNPLNLKNKGQGLGAPKLSFRLPALTQSILRGWPLEARTLFQRVTPEIGPGGSNRLLLQCEAHGGTWFLRSLANRIKRFSTTCEGLTALG